MKWINVNKYLPGDTEWKIVRCVNKDSEDFYFMALYSNGWDFLHNEYNDENRMKVTHWCTPDKVQDE